MIDQLDTFPEDYYQPEPQLAEHYNRLVVVGRERMSASRAVITGLARNVSVHLNRTLARITKLGNMFGDVRVVIYENDSVDDTKIRLLDWKQKNPDLVTIISEARGDPVNPGTRCLGRAARMAYYRNQARQYIVEKFPDFDYVIVADMDLGTGWSYDGIANTFGWLDEEVWHFVGSNGIMYKNGRPIHFDVWAFRWPGDGDRPTLASKINPRQWIRGQHLHPMNSCFGGLGVYVMEAMKVSYYDGSDCEHVPFHRRMREAGLTKIFMNPSQIVIY